MNCAAIRAPADEAQHVAEQNVVVPLVLETPAGLLSFISTTTVFGTPVDVTLSELALETFFPADARDRRALAAGDRDDGRGDDVGLMPAGPLSRM